MSPIFRHIWQCKICCWPVCSRKTAGARCCCKGSTTILSSINPLKKIFFPCRAGKFLLKKLHTYIFLVQWLYFKLEPKLQMLNKYTSTFFNKFYSQCNIIINSLPTFFTNIESRHHAARFVVASICR